MSEVSLLVINQKLLVLITYFAHASLFGYSNWKARYCYKNNFCICINDEFIIIIIIL